MKWDFKGFIGGKLQENGETESGEIELLWSLQKKLIWRFYILKVSQL